MDPEATLTVLDQSISNGNLIQARDYLGYYRDWRRKQGFEPQNVAGSGKAGDLFAIECARRLTDAERQAFPALPIYVNWNGASFDELLRLRVNAVTALRDALTALVAMQPHASDYPCDSSLFNEASRHHATRLSALLVVRDNIQGEAQLLQAIADQR